MAPSLFDVISDPARRRILTLLATGERTAGDLVAALPMSQPGVSKHLKVLRDAGLVSVRADAQRRVYALRAAPLTEVDNWLQPFRHLWADKLDALDRHLDYEA